MVRNHNGYWMSPKFFMSADTGGASSGDAQITAETGSGADSLTADASRMNINGADAGNDENGSDQESGDPETLNAEIARLKAEMAKEKAAKDKAMKEAGEARKALKAKMTAEEIAAKEKEEADEAQRQRIVELEKQVAKTGTVKAVMGKLGLSEEAAGNLADHLFGAADIENALLEIQKAWQEKETALRREYGKIPGPGAGADSNSPEAQAIKRAAEIGKQRNAVNEQAQKAMSAYIR